MAFSPAVDPGRSAAAAENAPTKESAHETKQRRCGLTQKGYALEPERAELGFECMR